MKRKYNYNLLVWTVALGASVASCKVTKPYEAPSLEGKKNLYREVVSDDTTSIASLPWRQLFADPVLQALIEEGVNNNLNLKNAVEQINKSRAVFDQSRQAFLPSLSFAPQISRNKSSKAALNLPPTVNINLKTTTYQLGFNASWELDVWGKLGSAKRAVWANVLQSEATKRAVQTQLISDIATTYYALLALDKQLAITTQTIGLREKGLHTMRKLKESAIVNGAAVVQSEANLHAAEVSVPDLKKNIRELEHALCLLLNREPGTIERSTLDTQQITASLQTGVPAQLLANRPDIEAAELAFRYAFENTNLARTYFYPSLSITSANMGISALSQNNLFKNSLFYTLVGGLTQPILDKGVNKARLKTAKADQEIAFNNFQQKLLSAGVEVSNALYAYETSVAKEATRKKQIEALEKAVDYTTKLLQYSSSTNYTDVLTSEQSLLAAQLAGVNDKLQQLQATVNLYRALGGGWK